MNSMIRFYPTLMGFRGLANPKCWKKNQKDQEFQSAQGPIWTLASPHSSQRVSTLDKRLFTDRNIFVL